MYCDWLKSDNEKHCATLINVLAAEETAAMRKIMHSTLSTMTMMRKKSFLRMTGMHIMTSITSSRVIVMPQRPRTARFPVCCCCVTQFPHVPVSVFRVPSGVA